MKLVSTHAMHTNASFLRENSTLTYMTIQDLYLESNKNFEEINYEFKKITIRNSR